MIPERVALRVLSKWHPEGTCWVSDYSVGSHGYAQVGWADHGLRTMVLAHRAVWVWQFGDIPEGMTVDHTCKVRRCVNPSHLRLLSNFENGRRTNGRDWPEGQCARGHDNVFLRRQPSGRSRCTKCMTIDQRAYRARKRSRHGR